MNCNVENYNNYAAPVLAGTFRFLLGLAVLLSGFYLASYSDVQGHGLGWLLVFGSPFIILKDEK